MIIIWVIDQAWGQDGWISAKLLFFCVFIDRCGVEVHELTRKERSRYPATLNEHTWSIKISYMVFRNFSCGTERVVPRNEVITEQGTAQGKVFRLRFFVYRPEALRRPWKKKPRIKYFSTRRLLTYATFSELDVVAITHETVFVNDQSYALMNCWHVRDKMGFSGPADVIPYSLTHVIPPHGLPTSNTVGVLGSKERVGGPPRGYLI